MLQVQCAWKSSCTTVCCFWRRLCGFPLNCTIAQECIEPRKHNSCARDEDFPPSFGALTEKIFLWFSRLWMCAWLSAGRGTRAKVGETRPEVWAPGIDDFGFTFFQRLCDSWQQESLYMVSSWIYVRCASRIFVGGTVSTSIPEHLGRHACILKGVLSQDERCPGGGGVVALMLSLFLYMWHAGNAMRLEQVQRTRRRGGYLPVYTCTGWRTLRPVRKWIAGLISSTCIQGSSGCIYGYSTCKYPW